MNQDLYLVPEGFHLVSTDPAEMENIVQEMKELTKLIGSCHCTGERAIKIFRNVFKENYTDIRRG